jgi:hypothetical protein
MGHSKRDAAGPLKTFGVPFLHLLAICVFLLLGSGSARAQGFFASSTPVPTPIPGGAAEIGEPSATSTKGPGTPGAVQLPEPQVIMHVGGEPVLARTGKCAAAILHALEGHTAVPAPNKDCADEMNRALDLQRTRPECASGPCGDFESREFGVMSLS